MPRKPTAGTFTKSKWPFVRKPASGIPAMGAGTGGPAFHKPMMVLNESGRLVPMHPIDPHRKALAEEAQAIVAELMRSSESDIVRLNAANSLQNRILGMPKQTVDATVTETVVEETDAADEIILRRLGAAQPADANG